MRHYLVDFENITAVELRELSALSSDCCIHIFYLTNTAKISLEALTEAKVKAHKLDMGPQELETQIATFLGYLIGADKERQNQFQIITRENNYGRLIRFWNLRGVRVEVRRAARAQEPVTYRSAPAPAPVRVAPPQPQVIRREVPKPAPAPVAPVAPVTRPAPVARPVQPVQQPIQPKAAPAPVRPAPVKAAPAPVVKREVPKPAPARTKAAPVVVDKDHVDYDGFDPNVYTPEVRKIVERIMENNKDNPNRKQSVYMSLMTKFGQKNGLAIYRPLKPYLE